MRPMRLLSVLAIAGLMLTISACGGNNAGSSTGASSGSDASSGSQASTAASAAAEPSSGGGGGSAGDLASLADALVPPNATQTVRTDAADGIFIAYSSTDSMDSLQGFYENAIKNAGMTIISTTTAADGIAWIFARGSDSSFGGSVTVAPESDSTGSTVAITLAGS